MCLRLRSWPRRLSEGRPFSWLIETQRPFSRRAFAMIRPAGVSSHRRGQPGHPHPPRFEQGGDHADAVAARSACSTMKPASASERPGGSKRLTDTVRRRMSCWAEGLHGPSERFVDRILDLSAPLQQDAPCRSELDASPARPQMIVRARGGLHLRSRSQKKRRPRSA